MPVHLRMGMLSAEGSAPARHVPAGEIWAWRKAVRSESGYRQARDLHQVASRSILQILAMEIQEERAARVAREPEQADSPDEP